MRTIEHIAATKLRESLQQQQTGKQTADDVVYEQHVAGVGSKPERLVMLRRVNSSAVVGWMPTVFSKILMVRFDL